MVTSYEIIFRVWHRRSKSNWGHFRCGCFQCQHYCPTSSSSYSLWSLHPLNLLHGHFQCSKTLTSWEPEVAIAMIILEAGDLYYNRGRFRGVQGVRTQDPPSPSKIKEQNKGARGALGCVSPKNQIEVFGFVCPISKSHRQPCSL